MRTNVLLTAFAHDVVTFGSDGYTIIKGCEDGLTELELMISQSYAEYRVVSFRM